MWAKASSTMWIVALLAPFAAAQAGDARDAPGTRQELPIPATSAPPAPFLAPDQALASLRLELAPGEKAQLELVAAEPLVIAPVTAAFDAAGRLWVCEMRSYMRDVDGSGESSPDGVIAVLSDRDGDGRFDHREEFATGLVLPRAITFVDDGVLVLSPPSLWFWRDTDGDGRGDDRQLVADGFGEALDNPEHAINSPRLGADGWIYFARYDRRLRRTARGQFEWQPVSAGGQWGLARDDHDGWWFNTNSDFARQHYVSPHYGALHQQLGRPAFVDQRGASAQTVWPARVNLGVNRAYQRGILRDDGRLADFTAACGALVHRGTRLAGGAWDGDLFVCEPSGNFVRRAIIDRAAWPPRARNALHETEWLSSTDERFRPVDVIAGPDGAIYVVDMYRGVIQHRNFVTSYLRRHVEALALEQPIDAGRIYRVVSRANGPQRTLDPRASTVQWIAGLSSSEGFERELAQRALLDPQHRAAARPMLDALARDRTARTIARTQALYLLDTTGSVPRASLFEALRDPDHDVQRVALRLCEPRLAALGRDGVDHLLLHAVIARAEDSRGVAPPPLRLQFVLTLAQVAPTDAAARELADRASMSLLAEPATGELSAALRDAVLLGWKDRESAFLQWCQGAPQGFDRSAAMRRAAACIARRRAASEVATLLAFAAACETPALRHAMLDGALDGLPAAGATPFPLAIEPPGFARLAESDDPGDLTRALRLRDVLSFDVGRSSASPSEVSIVAADLLARGERLYAQRCVACHLVDGEGGSIAPPLRGSEWVLGDAGVLARIVLHGVAGPIVVRGERYDLAGMAGHADLDDTSLAELLTYLRRAWDHAASPVEGADVALVREATVSRSAPWREAELHVLREAAQGAAASAADKK